MITAIKNAFCYYLMQLAFNCDNDYLFHKILDKVIDECGNYQCIDGDEDLKTVFSYVCEYRKFDRHLIDNKPEISNSVILKALSKSVF